MKETRMVIGRAGGLALVAALLFGLMIGLSAVAMGGRAGADGRSIASTPARAAECADPYEPNNWFDQATPAEFDILYNAEVCPVEDSDYYVFYLEMGQEVVIDLFNLAWDATLDLYGPLTDWIETSANGGSVPEQIVYVAEQAGNYYVRVWGTEGELPNPYTLRITSSGPTATSTPTPTPTATAQGCPDGYEPNDDFDTASRIAAGTPIPSYICTSDDLDYFAFNVSEGQQISVRLYDMAYNADLELYDPTRALIGQSYNAGTAEEEIVLAADQPGTYYALVFGTQDELVNPYELLVTLSGGATPTPTPTPTATPRYPGCPDGFEPNDVCGGPAWSLTESGWWSYVCTPEDLDYWKIPSVGISHTIQVTLTDLPKNYNLSLYRPNCTWAAQSARSGTSDEAIRFTADVSGTWYARVDSQIIGDYDTAHPYHIAGEVLTPTPTPTPTSCQPDRLEPNDSYQQALLRAWPYTDFITTSLSICSGDEDWFAVGLDTHDTLRATIGFRHADGDLDLAIYNDDEPPSLVKKAESRTDDEQLEYEALSKGYYYVRVYPKTSGGENPDYDLALQVFAPTPTPTPTQTPTPTPTSTPHVCPSGVPTLDLRIRDMEITQSIQNLDNDVPLVGYKLTVVRLFVVGDHRETLSAPLRGYLTATRGGAQIGPSRVRCASQQFVIDTLTDPSKVRERARITNALYCYVPKAWTRPSQKITIQGHVQVPSGYCDPDLKNNEDVRTVTFGDANTITIRAVQVREGCDDPGCGPFYRDYKSMHLLIQRMFPVARVRLTRRSGDYVKWDSSAKTLLALYNKLVQDPRSNDRGFAVVGFKKGGHWFMAGESWAGLQVAWVRTDDLYRRSEDLAHELGHALGGLGHVQGCWLPGAPFENYPYPGTWLSNGGDRDYWGIDTWYNPPTIKHPKHNSDLMTYCRPKWISDYSYRQLIGRLNPTPVAKTSAAAITASELEPDADYLIVMGRIDTETQAVSVRPMTKLSGSSLHPMPDVPSGAPYTAQLVDGEGNVVSERPFDLIWATEASTSTVGAFMTLLPYEPTATRFVITHEDEEIYSLDISPHPPTVSVHPVTGTAPDILTLSWEAQDADGDAVTSAVYLSVDGGETWELLASDLEETQVTLDTYLWPETSEGMLKVMVTDGINTSEDVTGPFIVTAKVPIVFVVAPEDGAALLPGAPVLLAAAGYDAEDGPLGDGGYTWSSDRDGGLGTGEKLLVPSLSPGWHRITVTAVDGDGNVASDTIRVYVGHRTYLPMLLGR
ncbi:MAG: hypothetical protein GXP39_13635 [Chloroflexi bacterium]|nr:hypothetical protein [Chloroflexota bacterium]